MNNKAYKGTNKLLVGIVMAVLAFWLFAQSMLNIAPDVQKSVGLDSCLLYTSPSPRD